MGISDLSYYYLQYWPYPFYYQLLLLYTFTPHPYTMIPKLAYSILTHTRILIHTPTSSISTKNIFSNSPISYQFCNTKKPKSSSPQSTSTKQQKTIHKKHNKQQPQQSQKSKTNAKTKGYNLQGVDQSKLPEHLKRAYQIKKQALNLEVPSQAQLDRMVIFNQIKRQREQIQKYQSQGQGQAQVQGQAKDQTQTQTQKPTLFFFQKVLLALTASNLSITAFLCSPILQNNFYYLGMYSNTLLYPSLLTTTCMAIGINLAYLIFRQGLCMHTTIPQLKPTTINITQSPFSYYLQMSLLALQYFSIAASVSMPILLNLPLNYKNTILYIILLSLLAVNGHTTLQQKYFINPHYKLSIQSICFVIMLMLSAYVHYTYSVKEILTDRDGQNCQKFKNGQNRIKNIWKIDRINVREGSKITDIIQADKQKQNQNVKKGENIKIEDKIKIQ